MENNSTANKHGRVIAAATDGACSGNPGPGGWGALIRFEDGSVKEFGGHEPSTTNNRMEMKAALEIFSQLKGLALHPNLTIRTDSKYLINGLTEWIQNWKKKNWKTASGKPVQNKDLWEALDQASFPEISLEYVKAHNGDPDNERADAIAVGFSKGENYLIQAKSPIKSTPINKKCPETKNDPIHLPASSNLKKLISRFEIASYLATNKYKINIIELSDLLDESIDSIKSKKMQWVWRNWVIKKTNDHFFILHFINKTEEPSTEQLK